MPCLAEFGAEGSLTQDARANVLLGKLSDGKGADSTSMMSHPTRPVTVVASAPAIKASPVAHENRFLTLKCD
jgi:hypothetical protein